MDQIAHPSASPLIEVVDLSFRHPGRQQLTLEGINLTIRPGEIVLLAGATGSGKSTLLNCIAGIIPEHTGGSLKGQILYRGTDLQDASVRQRSHEFCILLQNVETQIFTDRVWDEVVFGLENWNLPADQIPSIAQSVLYEFGLEGRRDWSIQRLSAGQKQRLLLACLLAIGQPVLLLDEPLAYLDANGVEQLLQLLKAKANQGQSILLVEHRLDLVGEICDRAYFFQDGKLSEHVLDKPGDRTGLDIATNVFSEALKLKSEKPVPQRSDTPAETLLRTRELSWGGYSAFPDFDVNAGETILLKGDNGCGKTTLLKLLSGLLKPTTGTLEIVGRYVSKRSVIQISKQVGFVLQNPNHQLFADSVRAEVLQPGISPQLADTLLQQLNLQEFADKHPQALSQGQKRRLALASVLVRQPRICLLDEIVVGQDPTSLLLMLRVLQQFTRQGNALILTSHVPLAAEALDARVIALS